MKSYLAYYTLISVTIMMEHDLIKCSTQGKTSKFPSVIKHLESSLAASTAHGSVVAVRALEHDCSSNEDTDCVVIVSRSPTHASQSNLTLSSILNEDKVDAEITNSSSIDKVGNVTTTRLSRGPVSSKVSGFQHHNDMLYTLHDSGVIAVTGLASDCKHLIRSAMMDISRYEYMYGSRIKSIPFVKTVLVEGLVKRISSAAFSAGGRPFGVQILTVSKSQSREEDKCPSLEIYTIDPSGALRQWNNKAVAIGRFAQIILQNLNTKLNSKEETLHASSNEKSRKIYIQEAIHLTIQSIIESEEDEKLKYLRDRSNSASACSEFEIVVVHSSKYGSVSKVHNIHQLYEESILNSDYKQ